MKLVLLLVLFAHAFALDKKYQNGQEKIDLNQAGELFQQFMMDYNRYYEDNKSRLTHFKSFKKTLKEINSANSGETIYGARFGITSFADYTEKELRRFLSLLKANKRDRVRRC